MKICQMVDSSERTNNSTVVGVADPLKEILVVSKGWQLWKDQQHRGRCCGSPQRNIGCFVSLVAHSVCTMGREGQGASSTTTVTLQHWGKIWKIYLTHAGLRSAGNFCRGKKWEEKINFERCWSSPFCFFRRQNDALFSLEKWFGNDISFAIFFKIDIIITVQCADCRPSSGHFGFKFRFSRISLATCAIFWC